MPIRVSMVVVEEEEQEVVVVGGRDVSKRTRNLFGHIPSAPPKTSFIKKPSFPPMWNVHMLPIGKICCHIPKISLRMGGFTN